MAAVLMITSQKYRCPPGTGMEKMLMLSTMFMAVSIPVTASHRGDPLFRILSCEKPMVLLLSPSVKI